MEPFSLGLIAALYSIASIVDDTVDDNDIMLFRFGYDPINDDYKVVKVMFRFGGIHLDTIQGSVKVEVYRLQRGGCWHSVNGFPSISFICNIDEVCVDGHLYWTCYVKAAGTKKTIVDFDLGAETFNEISLPATIGHVVLGVLSQKLCVMSSIYKGGCEVWLLVDHKWVKQHVFAQFGDRIDPIGFTSKNAFLFTTFDNRLALYDPDAAEVKFFNANRQESDTKVVEHVESLVWPPSLRANMEN